MKPDPSEDWYVGFVPCERHGVWRLADRTFGHCMAFRCQAPVWLLVEYNVFGLDVRTMEIDEIAKLMTLCQRKGALLKVAGGPRAFRWLPPLGLTCVTAITGLLGLRLWCLTPRQLYKALLRRGAKPVPLPVPEPAP